MEPGAANPTFDGDRPEPDLGPLAVVPATDAGGWAVVNTRTLKVVEPGYRWAQRASAVRWALAELDRERREELEYRRRLDEPVARGLARSWAAAQPDATRRRAGAT